MLQCLKSIFIEIIVVNNFYLLIENNEQWRALLTGGSLKLVTVEVNNVCREKPQKGEIYVENSFLI